MAREVRCYVIVWRSLPISATPDYSRQTLTDTHDNYSNPRCACAPEYQRFKKSFLVKALSSSNPISIYHIY